MSCDLICAPEDVAVELSGINKKNIKRVPVMASGCMTYFVSEDGRDAWAAHEIGGKSFVKKLYIDWMYKKPNTAPQFGIRYASGIRSKISMAKAVYGAFVSGKILKTSIEFLDGNAKNCHISNLKARYEIQIDLSRYVQIYPQFNDMVAILRSYFPEVSIPDIEDACAQAYIELCSWRKKALYPFPMWLRIAKHRILTLLEDREFQYNDEMRCDFEVLNDDSILHHDLKHLLKDREYKICQLYCDGYSQVEIAKQIGFCRDVVMDSIGRTRQILSSWFEIR